MKTLVKFFFLMAIIGLAVACQKTEEVILEDDMTLKSGKMKTVTVPFEANLLGEITNIDFEAQECIDEGYMVSVIVETSGNATHMGKASLTFNFCSGGAPDPGLENAKYTYAGSNAELIAANGDMLYLYFHPGVAFNGRTDEHPDDVYEYWRAPISVMGGTGRFEGAKGELSSDDYLRAQDDHTHHRFFGEITLVKGKRK